MMPMRKANYKESRDRCETILRARNPKLPG
jgi:hypothetical protein